MAFCLHSIGPNSSYDSPTCKELGKYRLPVCPGGQCLLNTEYDLCHTRNEMVPERKSRVIRVEEEWKMLLMSLPSDYLNIICKAQVPLHNVILLLLSFKEKWKSDFKGLAVLCARLHGSQLHLRALLVMASALDAIVLSAASINSPHWGLARQREEGGVVCIVLTSRAQFVER